MKKSALVLMIFLFPLRVLAASPEDFYNAGMDLMKQKDYEKAVQYFRAAVDQRPDYWQAYQFLGEAYFQSSNRTEAVVAMRESLRLHPHNPDLKKFMERIKQDSPWVPADLIWEKWLVILSAALSILSLFLTLYGARRKTAPPRP